MITYGIEYLETGYNTKDNGHKKNVEELWKRAVKPFGKRFLFNFTLKYP